MSWKIYQTVENNSLYRKKFLYYLLKPSSMSQVCYSLFFMTIAPEVTFEITNAAAYSERILSKHFS